jgi:hypothetical protein
LWAEVMVMGMKKGAVPVGSGARCVGAGVRLE